MDEWNALEEAIREQRWRDAAGAARAFQEAWGDAKSAVLWFATDEVETKMNRIDTAMSALTSLLEHDPVDEIAVQAAKAEALAVLPPWERP